MTIRFSRLRRTGARRLFLRYAINNILLLALPLCIAVIYYGVSVPVLRDGIDSFAEAQLKQSIDVIDREFWELDKMVNRVGNDYDINFYLSNNGRFTDMEYYGLHNLSAKLAPYVQGSPIVSHVLLYLHRSRTLISESSFGYYDDYYGTVVSVEGYEADQWQSVFLSSLRQTEFLPSVSVRMHGNEFDAHLYRSNIGYGDYYRGSLVAVISADELRGFLARTPQQYGGWVHVSTARGKPVVTTDPDAETVVTAAIPVEGRQSTTINGERLRLYRMTSPVTGWRYTAALNETLVFAEVRLVRTIALVLLSLGLVAGLGVSYLFAFRSSKPWMRLFDIVGQESFTSAPRPVSAYRELESAIDILANRHRRMEEEIGAAEEMTRHYFFQNVLRGAHRSRRDFERGRNEFGVAFSSHPHYVIVARIMPLNAVRGDETYRHLRDELSSAIDSCRGNKDVMVPISFDDIVLIREIDPAAGLHEDATTLITTIRRAINFALRGDYCYGIGTAVEEPFLLTLSYNQAMTAVTPLDGEGHDLMRFYDEVTDSSVFYSYPLDVEESLIRAVRAGNHELVSQLISSLERENFDNRRLTDAEVDDLFVELKGTILKLYNAMPGGNAWPDHRYDQWWAMGPTREKLHRFEALCRQLGDRYDGRKRSHNSVLLTAIQEHLEEHYADPNLGLTSMAEVFKRSENYLSGFYKEQTGMRLSDDIQKIRMERARELLTGDFESIDRVAELCGYANPASFRRAFKRVFGVSPSEFRVRRNL